MEFVLKYFYSIEDCNLIKKAFDLRNISQYYVDSVIDEKEIDFIMDNTLDFFNKTNEILLKLNEDDVRDIRGELERLKP